MKELPDVCITLKNATEELTKLLHLVKPSWNKDQIELKKLSGGYSCLMYRCFETGNPEDGVTVRAKNNTQEDIPNMLDAASESKVVRTMTGHGLFPEILATFQNGFCYQYISGKPVYSFGDQSFTLDESTMRLMARKLAEIHSVKVEGFDYSAPTYFQNMYTLLKEKYPADDKLPPSLPKRDEFYRELKQVEEYALATGSTMVHCHGDPHPGNMVYDKEKGTLTYVDWELSHVGYQAGDVGAALQVLVAVKIGLPQNFSRKYIRYYLEKWFETQGREASEVTDADVDKLELQANVFRLSIQQLWMLLMLPLFAVKMPDYLNTDDMKTLQSVIRPSSSESDETSSPAASGEEMGMQMVVNVYETYLGMKDEILAKSKNQ